MKNLESLLRPAALGLGVALLFATAGAALADTYPSKPIRFIVPFPPGGSADIIARIMSDKLAPALGQPVVIEDRPGAGGNIGAEMAAKSPPDGYTIVLGSTGNMAINASLYQKLPYDPVKDFVPVILWSSEPNILVVHPSIPAGSVRELIALAKASPGKLHFASAGNGTSQHLAGELFKTMAGVAIIHVPYKGGVTAITDVIGGRVEMTFSSLIATLPYVKSGKLRALGVTSSKRSAVIPSLPTVAEAGLPGYEVTVWFGVLFPARTPTEYVNKMHGELAKILAMPDLRERLTSQGSEPGGGTPEEFAAYIKQEAAKWGKLVKDSGAQVE